MTLQEDIDTIETGLSKVMLGFHTRATCWTAALVGFVLAMLALAAWLLHVPPSEPQVLALVLSTAAWFAWVTFDFAIAPLRPKGVRHDQDTPEYDG